MLENYHIFLFSGTHWDREWYQPFQKFRFRLVSAIGRMIEFLEENPAFGVFHLDGQSVLFEDYLEIVPEKESNITELLEQGRITVGPWYVMPDELLPSGEALIRNFLEGFRLAQHFGVKPWACGYLCDTFGHISQMPQILQGFGMTFSVVGRGTNEHTTPAFFRWASPDGSEVSAFRLNDWSGYSTMKPLFRAFEEENIDDNELKHRLTDVIQKEIGRTPLPLICLMDANDHEPLHESTEKVLSLLKELFPEAEVHHTNLLDMSKLVAEHISDLPVKKGELIEPGKEGGFAAINSHTLSSRYPLKMDNDRCQIVLEKVVHPVTVLGRLYGKKVEKGFLSIAWKLLLKNQAHDSLCGCSIDQVHRDMEARFDQVKSLCEGIVEHLLPEQDPDPKGTGTTVSAAELPDELYLRLFNSLPFERDEVLTLPVDLPPGFCGYVTDPAPNEYRQNFHLIDDSGNEVPYSIAKIERNFRKRIYAKRLSAVDRHLVTARVHMNGLADTWIRVVPVDVGMTRYPDSLVTAPLTAENEFVKLTVKQDGTFDLFHKDSGRSILNFNRFVSDGEVGDGWYHRRPLHGGEVWSSGNSVVVELAEDSCVRAVFCITQTLSLPAEIIWEGRVKEAYAGVRNSENRTELTIRTRVSVCQGSRLIGLDVEVKNCVKDHRLRMAIPTGARSDHWLTGQAFALIKRPVGRDRETDRWKEIDPIEKNFSGIAGRVDENGIGLFCLSAWGLHEAATRSQEDDHLYITLLRAFRRTRDTDGEPGGQLQQILSFKSGLLMTDDKSCRMADLLRFQESIQVPPVVRTLYRRDGFSDRPFMTLEGAGLVVSILKLPEGGGAAKAAREQAEKNPEEGSVIIRLYNPSDAPVISAVLFDFDIRSAQKLTLDEKATGNAACDSHRLEVILGAWEIKTYRVDLAV